MRHYVERWLETHDGKYPEPGEIISDEHLLGVNTFLMKWSDRSPAMRVLAIGAGGLLSVDVLLLILATLHVIPIDPLVYIGFPILAVIGAGVIVAAILDQRWQLDQAVRRAREEDDGGPT